MFVNSFTQYWLGLTLFLASLFNYIHYEVRVEITSPFPTFRGAVED